MLNDNELMELVKQDDRKAFETLVLRYRVKIYNFVKQYVKDYDLPEDIVQDVFVSIYIKRMNFKPNHNFKTYIFTIAKNKTIDYLRKQKEISLYTNISATPSTEDIILKQEKEKMINSVLNSLKTDDKIILYLYAYENMSYKEIAIILGKTLPQIKIQIYRARKKIKSKLKEYLNEC